MWKRQKFEIDFDKSDTASRNSSHANLSIQANDKVHLLQESSPSNHSYQEIKTKELEIYGPIEYKLALGPVLSTPKEFHSENSSNVFPSHYAGEI